MLLFPIYIGYREEAVIERAAVHDGLPRKAWAQTSV